MRNSFLLLGPMLRRRWIRVIRRRGWFAEWTQPAALLTLILAGMVVGYDVRGLDRASVEGMREFAVRVLGVMVVAQLLISGSQVLTFLTPAIALERDRKTLDAVLTTRLGSSEIVLGVLAAELGRVALGWLALAPVGVVLIWLGGIDPRWLGLAIAAVASTTLLVAAVSVASSAAASSVTNAAGFATTLICSWLYLPLLGTRILPIVWPASAPWVVPVANWVQDSNPVAVILSVGGLSSRGSLVEVVGWMVGAQSILAVALITWTIARLRAWSRAVVDQVGSAESRRLSRTRWRGRRPCGDDPILWRELHATRRRGRLSWLLDRVVLAVGIGVLGFVASWFALPAWAELRAEGYGPMAASAVYPEMNPVARVFLNRFLSYIRFANLFPTPPGQARFEFNIALRQVSVVLDLVYVLLVSGFAAESVVSERERDTWPGVLATPLTGASILGGKRLGAIHRSRWLAIPLVALWLVGTVTGAVHPVGLILALLGLVVSTWFLAALGVFISAHASDRQGAVGWSLVPMMVVVGLGLTPFIAPGVASVVPAAVIFPFPAWAGLLGYDDVAALARGRGIAIFTVVGIDSNAGAWSVLAASLASTIAQAIAARWLIRAADRGFDATVGRPVRGRGTIKGAPGGSGDLRDHVGRASQDGAADG